MTQGAHSMHVLPFVPAEMFRRTTNMLKLPTVRRSMRIRSRSCQSGPPKGSRRVKKDGQSSGDGSRPMGSNRPFLQARDPWATPTGHRLSKSERQRLT